MSVAKYIAPDGSIIPFGLGQQGPRGFPGDTHFLGRNTDTQYRLISAAIRKTAGVWAPIEDSGHAPSGVASVVDQGNDLRVNYGFTAKKVSSFTITTDETYAQEGLFLGASVGYSAATVRFFRMARSSYDIVSGYISWNGTEWIKSVSQNINAIVQINPYTVEIQHTTVHPIGVVSVSVTGRGSGPYIYRIGSSGNSATRVEIYNLDGTPVAAPATNMLFFVNRFSNQPLIPAVVTPASLPESNANFWVVGWMEV